MKQYTTGERNGRIGLQPLICIVLSLILINKVLRLSRTGNNTSSEVTLSDKNDFNNIVKICERLVSDLKPLYKKLSVSLKLNFDNSNVNREI